MKLYLTEYEIRIYQPRPFSYTFYIAQDTDQTSFLIILIYYFETFNWRAKTKLILMDATYLVLYYIQLGINNRDFILLILQYYLSYSRVHLRFTEIVLFKNTIMTLLIIIQSHTITN